jgi:hypothetical protein
MGWRHKVKTFGQMIRVFGGVWIAVLGLYMFLQPNALTSSQALR